MAFTNSSNAQWSSLNNVRDMRIKLPIKELQSAQHWVNYSPSALIRPGTQRPREKESDKGVERVTKEWCDLKAGGTEKEEKKGISLLCNRGLRGEGRLMSVAYNKISVDERRWCNLMEQCHSAGAKGAAFHSTCGSGLQMRWQLQNDTAVHLSSWFLGLFPLSLEPF